MRSRASTRSNRDGIKLAELGPGDSFGDQALISDEKRSATVTMLTDGTLMRLNKSDFNSLLKEPMLQWVSYAEGTERVANTGAKWLDVRMPSEFASAHLPGAINLPLYVLRKRPARSRPHVYHVIRPFKSSGLQGLQYRTSTSRRVVLK